MDSDGRKPTRTEPIAAGAPIDFFRRGLDSFIRAKYEQRKWIAKEWIPPDIAAPMHASVVPSSLLQRMESGPVADRDRRAKLKVFSMPTPTEQPTVDLLDLGRNTPDSLVMATVLYLS